MASKKKASTKAPKPSAEERTIPLAIVDSKVAKQTYEIVQTTSLKLHPKNPRRGNVDAIGESIEENGFFGAVLVQKSTGHILAGNHRYKSAIEKGIAEIPAIVIDVDDARAEKILLADNRVAELASYDERALASLLDEVKARNMSTGLRGTGFAEQDLMKLHAKATPPNQFPEYTEQVKVTYRCPNCDFKW